MTVRGNRSVGYVIVSVFIGLCAALFLAGRAVGLIVSLLCAAFSVVSFLRVGEVLLVRPDELRYRRTGLLGVRSASAPRSALAAVRVRTGAAHEIRTAAVDVVLLDRSLPTAVRVFESIDGGKALAVGRQVAEHVGVPVFDELPA